jgi:hypothetical protein
MASIKKGIATAPKEAWKHLRWAKRRFWKAERRAAAKIAWRQAD